MPPFLAGPQILGLRQAYSHLTYSFKIARGEVELTRRIGGPFEYWLTRTKAQEIENNEIIDDYVSTLQEGSLPDAMRGLLRAATMFPNSVSNSYKK